MRATSPSSPAPWTSTTTNTADGTPFRLGWGRQPTPQRRSSRAGRPGRADPQHPAAPLGPAPAAARRGPGGVRRPGLPRRGDGRHRRRAPASASRCSTSTSRASSTSTWRCSTSTPRRWSPPCASRSTSTTDNKLRVAATIEAYFRFVDEDGGAFRLVFESDLTNQPEVRERVDGVTPPAPRPSARSSATTPGCRPSRPGCSPSGWPAWLRSRRATGSPADGTIPRDAAARLLASLSLARHRRLPAHRRAALTHRRAASMTLTANRPRPRRSTWPDRH